jgi:hypothetical protein
MASDCHFTAGWPDCAVSAQQAESGQQAPSGQHEDATTAVLAALPVTGQHGSSGQHAAVGQQAPAGQHDAVPAPVSPAGRVSLDRAKANTVPPTASTTTNAIETMSLLSMDFLQSLNVNEDALTCLQRGKQALFKESFAHCPLLNTAKDNARCEAGR